ncbi:MAG: hypothetical protein ACD_45C00194G0003 [uncultured bacterium]|nr:MAG: hypothetical protein ACD_45C00194G0003 [uncultured bacterium]
MATTRQQPHAPMINAQSIIKNFRSSSVISEQMRLIEHDFSTINVACLHSKELKNYGIVLHALCNYMEAGTFFNKALNEENLACYESDEKDLIRAECYCYLASIAREKSDLKTTLKYYNAAKTILHQLAGKNFSEIYADIQYFIARDQGMTQLALKNFDYASQYFTLATQIAITSQQATLLPIVKSYTGFCLVFMNRPVEGLKLLREARLLFEQHTDYINSLDWATHCYHVGTVYEIVPVDAHSPWLVHDQFRESLRLTGSIRLSIETAPKYPSIINTKLAKHYSMMPITGNITDNEADNEAQSSSGLSDVASYHAPEKNKSANAACRLYHIKPVNLSSETRTSTTSGHLTHS